MHAAPGNPGMAAVATLHAVDQLDGTAVAALAVELGVDLVVVGPEAPLVAGVADAVRDAGISCFGPSAEAAVLEGSKAFAKDVMAAAEVPTAMAHVCTTAEEAAAALDAFGPPYVVKDDGLAAGKGVVVTEDRDEALAHAVACDRVVIEEYLDGPEVSLFAITDGTTVLPLLPGAGLQAGRTTATPGPNTGGMGAYTPLPWAPADLVAEVTERVLQPDRRGDGPPGHPVLRPALRRPRADRARRPGRGVQRPLRRPGDPAAAGAARLAARRGAQGRRRRPARRGRPADLARRVPRSRWSSPPHGYPGTPAHRRPDHRPGRGRRARRRRRDPRRHRHRATAHVVTAGGRVLAVTAVGADVADARARAYAGVDLIRIDGSHHRTDIAAGV